jgi:hypothetical protein
VTLLIHVNDTNQPLYNFFDVKSEFLNSPDGTEEVFMRKIVSRQVPKATISRPLVVAGVLLAGAALAHAQDSQGGSDGSSKVDPLQTAISGDPGCVVGADEARKKPKEKSNPCRTVGCTVRCD